MRPERCRDIGATCGCDDAAVISTLVRRLTPLASLPASGKFVSRRLRAHTSGGVRSTLHCVATSKPLFLVKNGVISMCQWCHSARRSEKGGVRTTRL
eukprot:5059433-Prymnesium_polylepis.2